MGTKEYTKIESVNIRKHHVKTEESDNIPLPTSEERRKIIFRHAFEGLLRK